MLSIDTNEENVVQVWKTDPLNAAESEKKPATYNFQTADVSQ